MQAVEEHEQPPVSAAVKTLSVVSGVAQEAEPADITDDEDPYIVKNAMTIYSWARFQEGSIKLSDVKEVYMVY
jgi:hypothetical protein